MPRGTYQTTPERAEQRDPCTRLHDTLDALSASIAANASPRMAVINGLNHDDALLALAYLSGCVTDEQWSRAVTYVNRYGSRSPLRGVRLPG